MGNQKEKTLNELREENDLLKKLIENQINIDRIDEVISIKDSHKFSKPADEFILGCWEYDRREQIFIVDDILKSFFRLETNIMELDFYRDMIPEKERDEIIDTILLSFDNSIRSLKFENTIVNPATGYSYYTLTLMNNYYDNENNMIKSEGFLINITDLIIHYQHSRAKLSNEKYIGNIAAKLNGFISKDRTINFTLNELKRYRPSKNVYLMEECSGQCTLHSTTGEPESRFYSIKLNESNFNLDWKKFDHGNYMTLDSDADPEFFSHNSWIENENRILLIIPGRIDRHVRRAAVIDVTLFFDTVTASDILTYKAIVHIFEGTLKRIEEEFIFHQNELQQKILMEETPHLMCQIDTDGKIKFINRNFSERFEIPINDIHSFNFFDLLSEEEKEKFLTLISELTPSSPESSSKIRFTVKGQDKKLRLTNHAVFNNNGDIVLVNITAFEK